MTPPRHTEVMTCPECGGSGRYSMLLRQGVGTMACELCHTLGHIAGEGIEWRLKGQEFREKRVARGITIRDWARWNQLDVLTVSNAERGIIDPEVLRLSHEKRKTP